MTTLYIKPTIDIVTQYYQNHISFHDGDSGIDLFVPQDITFKPFETKFVDLQIQCEMKNSENKNISYYLYPRSSISKTPLILANSVGIIDAGYRGNIIAALRYIPFENTNKNFVLRKDTRIVQICGPSLEPLKCELVETLSETSRGRGGFGSTGK
jgi:dUTP pyrophosphatase